MKITRRQLRRIIKEARMGEYGKQDAVEGLPPSNTGKNNEEYMAAYNAAKDFDGSMMDLDDHEHAYDAAKEETAHYGTETDAIWEILGDLEDIGAPPALIATVEEAEQYEEDLSYVLSLIPVELKDKMI